ncbi:hypothetical protein [uncultured Gimesia sp.]|uniref:hypothetical protein n=1 Tax=uncultured Gimesia sp. TaxID=1678688 RepID=UPI0030DD50D8|tara:strand:+ start:63989 stop:64534 length:546 start_codon:yes stop_codon:yes gene_type:complete
MLFLIFDNCWWHCRWWWWCCSLLTETLIRCLTRSVTLLATEEDLRDLHHVVKSNERHLKIIKAMYFGQRWSKDAQTWSMFVAQDRAQTERVSSDFLKTHVKPAGFIVLVSTGRKYRSTDNSCFSRATQAKEFRYWRVLVKASSFSCRSRKKTGRSIKKKNPDEYRRGCVLNFKSGELCLLH